MAVKNRGLTREESLALSYATMTATGVEVLVSNAELYLYKVIVAGDYLNRVSTRVSVLDGTSSTGGTAGDNTFGVTIGSALGPATEVIDFNPPLHFVNGLVVSAYGFGADSSVACFFKT